MEATTIKIPTEFGSLYCHVAHDSGHVMEIRFSSPGKFDNTQIEQLLVQLGEAASAACAEIVEHWSTLTPPIAGKGEG